MDISHDYYKTFYHVAHNGSISRAAAAMNRGQPNVTKTIATLEAQLGCRLFVRSPKGMQLTPEGEKLYAHVTVAMQHIQAAERELVQDRSLQSGTVTIASSDIAMRCCLLPVLAEYRRLYPRVRVRLSNFSASQALEAAQNNLADFAILTTPGSFPKGMKVQEISQFQDVVVCGEMYRAMRERVLTLAELATLPIICMNPQTATYRFLADFFKRHGVIMQPDIEVATADQVLPLVRSNLGIGFVPEEFLENEEQVHRLHLQESIPSRSVYLLRREDTPISIAAKELERMLTAHNIHSIPPSLNVRY